MAAARCRPTGNRRRWHVGNGNAATTIGGGHTASSMADALSGASWLDDSDGVIGAACTVLLRLGVRRVLDAPRALARRQQERAGLGCCGGKCIIVPWLGVL